MSAVSIALTPEQESVISAPLAHYVVTAVAGSGKTTTLAHRINFLLHQGFHAQRMLILMFNRSAKLDFEKKLRELIDPGIYPPEVRTFHAMGYRLYERFISEGYLNRFDKRVLSEKEIHFQLWRLMNQFMEAESLKQAKRSKKDYIEAGFNFIEAVKNSLGKPQEVFESLQLNDKFKFVIELFDAFEVWRKDNKRITYTDMLYEPVLAIMANPHLQQLVSNKMDVILVDEYQDTNDLQHALLKFIAGERAKVTVVGDPDQTIYEFRGAKPEYIIHGFSEEFPGAIPKSLSHSFRYGHTISLLANHLIQHNKGRSPILCKSHDSTPLSRVSTHFEKNEVQQICRVLSDQSISLENSVILSRVWSQLAIIELGLIQNQVPYHIDGNKSVFNSDDTQSLIALLELSQGVFSLMAPEQRQMKFSLLLKFPHSGLGESLANALTHNLAQYESGWAEVLSSNIPSGLHKIQELKLQRLAHALKKLEQKPEKLNHMLNTYFSETDLFENIRNMSLSHEHAEERIALIKGICRFLGQQSHPLLPGQTKPNESTVAEALACLNQLQMMHQQKSPKAAGGVLLTSIHKAKGLEWDRVLIPGIRDKVLPYYYKDDPTTGALESERRLLYVAMTRAKEELHLFFPEQEKKSPQYSSEQRPESCFEKELNIETSLVVGEQINAGIKGSPSSRSITLSRIARRYIDSLNINLEELNLSSSREEELDLTPVWTASRVEHTLLGKGTVTSQTSKAFSVCFEDNNEKTFSKEVAERFFTVLEA